MRDLVRVTWARDLDVPHPWQENPHVGGTHMAPLADGTKYAIRAILTPVIKEVISLWNALPTANRA